MSTGIRRYVRVSYSERRPLRLLELPDLSAFRAFGYPCADADRRYPHLDGHVRMGEEIVVLDDAIVEARLGLHRAIAERPVASTLAP